MSSINTVLIANRGEIAVRIIRSCHKLGKRAVIVYHAADKDSLAVQLADAALEITGPTPVAAYLSIDNILNACKELGADAVHPGFGFLSENSTFASRIQEAGIRFIGPNPKAIAAMGDKIQSKRFAKQAGVNIIPGFDGEVLDAAHAFEIASSIGFPVIIKASAGGGGKGMRVVYENDSETCRIAYERTCSEALAAFGDARVFIEKYIEQPRHIEIQILADQHGATVHLGERECSIQRRHQKIVEEAPSSFVNEELRNAMGAQAVALATAVGYASAGTVEFVVDSGGKFYFLEMNTRIQVEHPITEMITGLDIVAEQIYIAEDTPLRFTQDDIKLNGHSIECRLCAEDSEHDFMPATGRLERFRAPQIPGFRLDSGVVEGDVIGSSFDSMIAKLIVHAGTRAEAIQKMQNVLEQTVVLGVTTNATYLERVVANEEFKSGNTTTAFLEENKSALKAPEPTEEQIAAVISAALLGNRTLADVRFTPPAMHSAIGAWRN